MNHKGVFLGVGLLFIFSAIAWAEEDTKKSNHVVETDVKPQEVGVDQTGGEGGGGGGGGPEYSEDQIGGGRGPLYSKDQLPPHRKCCKKGKFGICTLFCRNAEEVKTLDAYEEAGGRGTQYSVDQIGGRTCCQRRLGLCIRLCRNAEEVKTLDAYEEVGGRGTQYSVDQVGGLGRR